MGAWRKIRGRLRLGRVFWIALALLVVGGLLVSAWLVRPYWQLASHLGTATNGQASRLYGRPLRLAVGAALHPQDVIAELRLLGYAEPAPGEAFLPGRYRRLQQRSALTLDIFLRSHPTPAGRRGRVRVEATFEGGKVARLKLDGKAAAEARLEPVLLATYYDDRLLERRPVRLAEVPKTLVNGILAAEDARFYRHRGLSLRGILRAAWSNVKAGEVRQGGSTLTQQLVWNLYLTHERTFKRKAREALLAVLVDARYSKDEILEAYLNEIYLGQSGGVNLIGFGAAARAYFGKEVADLTLEESTTLAGIIPNPARFDPRRHPQAAKQRRDRVLDRMVELQWVTAAEAAAIRERPLRVAPVPVVRRRAPYFSDYARGEAERRFGLVNLTEGGFTLLSTLSMRDQQKAEEAVAWGVRTIEKGWQKGRPGGVQAALVSVDPGSGEILAYVGGRDYGESQFDRVSQAQRQAGSAFKPVVYAAAFEDGVASPATRLDDSPLTVELPTMTWTPKNDDEQFLGWVPARQAVEQSRNIPTARLAMEVGLDRVVRMARQMGITTALQGVPALALGAFEVKPLDLVTVYATLAAGGAKPPVHGLEAALGPSGQAIPGPPREAPERVLSAGAAYLVTSLLQGVVDHGTAASVRQQGLTDALAGKTGTTNGRRDSWFGGYAPGRATVVWVGYDDNSATRLSGGRAALPIWGRFTLGVRPPGGYRDFQRPASIVSAVIDPASAELATEACPALVTELFLDRYTPSTVCSLHSGFFVGPVDQPDPNVRQDPLGGFRGWLRKVFGKKGDRRPPPRN